MQYPRERSRHDILRVGRRGQGTTGDGEKVRRKRNKAPGEGSGKSGPIITDNGGFILDIKFKEITNPAKVEQQLNNLPGTLGNGIFTRKPLKVVVGKPDGTTTTL